MYLNQSIVLGFTDDNRHVDNLHYTNGNQHTAVRSSRQVRQQAKNHKRLTLVSSTVSRTVGYTHRNVVRRTRYASRSISMHGRVHQLLSDYRENVW